MYESVHWHSNTADTAIHCLARINILFSKGLKLLIISIDTSGGPIVYLQMLIEQIAGFREKDPEIKIVTVGRKQVCSMGLKIFWLGDCRVLFGTEVFMDHPVQRDGKDAEDIDDKVVGWASKRLGITPARYRELFPNEVNVRAFAPHFQAMGLIHGIYNGEAFRDEFALPSVKELVRQMNLK